jgi:hypothetical protein
MAFEHVSTGLSFSQYFKFFKKGSPKKMTERKSRTIVLTGLSSEVKIPTLLDTFSEFGEL